MSLNLTQRQAHIFRATVDHYISTAEPVGSKVLAHHYPLEISPATIRSVMGCLEKSGLLFQPHKSAGRVPSDSGYRHYVDQLIRPSRSIAQQFRSVLKQKLHPQKTTLESLLQQSAQLLAQFSGCLALITLPLAFNLTIRHLQLMRIEPRRVLLVIITDTYETLSTVIELAQKDAAPTWTELEQELSILSNFLNHHLVGRTGADLKQLDWGELDHEFKLYTHFIHQICDAIVQEMQPGEYPQVIFGGLSEILQQPEFNELKQAHTLIELFESPHASFLPLWDDSKTKPGFEGLSENEGIKTSVTIGAENPLKPIQTCTVISSHYNRASAEGQVSVIGPTRMAYEKIIALVEGTAEYLTRALCY